MIINSNVIERSGAMMIAELMAIAARTAPKGRGTDNLEILIVEGEEKDNISHELKEITKRNGTDFFERDGFCLDKSQVVVLIGTKISPMNCPDCGFCGYTDCAENVANNGVCAFGPGDLGIAIGSAVSISADHRCDSRVMFSVGRAALNLNLFSENVKIAYGIPLSVSGKSPFFDR